MPRKRVGRRHGRRAPKKGRKGRKFYKSAAGKGEVMVNRVSARLHNFVAPHYLTKLEYGFTGMQALAAGTQGYCDLQLNGLHLPGTSPGNPFTAATFGGTVYPAAAALGALYPVGYTVLSGIYQNYRVYASRIVVTCTPTTNPCVLCVAPGANVSSIIGTDFQKAQSQPYSKVITTTPSNNIKQNTIMMYMDAPTVVGLTKQQYNDADSTQAATGANPTYGAFWNIFTTQLAAGTATANAFEVRITYWCEFMRPLEGVGDT